MNKKQHKPVCSLCATLYRKDRKSGLRRIIFDTEEVDVVELKMAHIGIGSNAYWLSCVPRADGRRSHRAASA